jgi:hypothetical protein
LNVYRIIIKLQPNFKVTIYKLLFSTLFEILVWIRLNLLIILCNEFNTN